MIHREDVDPIIADHIGDGVRKATQASTSHTTMLDRVELGIALDPIEACVGGAKKRLSEPKGSRLVPSVSLVEVTLGTLAK